ncbi:hypothetical protein EUX98_g6583 [Antrodiella citrinella]|uniref:Uncharacterized protein n=1 Tax=Antrodiella citrinella TaxID=2447956 RepID=A0A4S4MNY0_9APHY|nr:hypothetical protein EUX98_g6583 [Antrodiella citrinella]
MDSFLTIFFSAPAPVEEPQTDDYPVDSEGSSRSNNSNGCIIA